MRSIFRSIIIGNIKWGECMKESKILEYKENTNNNFLKTVSAYANFGDGKIIFGIADDGTVKGLSDLNGDCLAIENKINDSILPKPDFELIVNEKNRTIELLVKEGEYKPYLYNGTAYRRSDTSTVKVDQVELKRLVLAGKNMEFEDLPSLDQDLKFTLLEKLVKERLNIEEFTTDILRTLGFYTKKHELNNAAAIVADENPFYGTDIVKFGVDINQILSRRTIDKQSIFKQYEEAIEFYKLYYRYEEVRGVERTVVEKIPETAFREVMANALVHRTWDINIHVRVAMFEDRIEISSPGGLPNGLSKEEYLEGYISSLRNLILGSLFYRLHLIERLGTGIRRIKEAYKGKAIQPQFIVMDNTITVVLPVVTDRERLTDDERVVLSAFNENRELTTAEVVEHLGYKRGKVIRLLNSLIEKQYITKIGLGRATRYKR